MTLHTVIFIGRSGSGKGTQADLLKDRFHRLDSARHILYIETGARFREFIRGGSLSAKRAKEINDEGSLQPDFLAAWMWGSALIEELEPDMHLVFDGAPRAESEARLLTTALGFYGRKNVTVIHIKVSRRWSEDRLLARGRADDTSLQKVDKRLDWFDKKVVPAIEYFKSDPFYKVIEVNGEQPIEKVHADIIAAYEYKK
ncbi:MAG: adk, adenylate kinase, adenylate kinase [Parcubacteria group bacterium]|nr:adk, adenylate kinase, adenylate kinase [Parcubacteria group bacterium]